MTKAKENYLLTLSFAKTVKGGERGLSELPEILRGIIERRPWEEIYIEPTGQTVKFANIREWIEAYPPEGLNAKVSTIEALIKDDPELLLEFRKLAAPTLANHGDIGNGRPGDSECDSRGAARTSTVTLEVKSVTRGSECPDYLVSRLHRDAPEYLGMIGEGKEYKTIREAAIAAGVLKQRVRIELKEDTVDTAKDIIKKRGVNYSMSLMVHIAEQLAKSNDKEEKEI